ncbi:MAG: hypothetical protein WDM78_17020 [Puia sp.]
MLERKEALSRIVPQILIIERQDSLQRIAEMTASDRESYIKKMLRAYRRQQGLAEDDNNNSSGGYGFRSNSVVPDMFTNPIGAGDWYFYNQSVKAKGYSDFKSRWGNRPNVDNWQVQSMIAQQITGLTPASNLRLNGAGPNAATPAAAQITAESLMAGLPAHTGENAEVKGFSGKRPFCSRKILAGLYTGLSWGIESI